MDKSEKLIGGKAEGLARLAKINGINVPAFVAVPADADAVEQRRLIDAFIRNNAGVSKVAVRSSALGEDGELASFAGAFKTHLNVVLQPESILEAIADIRNHGENKLSTVFNKVSKKQDASEAPSVGVVIQQMVEEPDFAGVCLSQGYREEDNAYLLLNFKTGLGDGLVGGEVNGRQLRVLRSEAFRKNVTEHTPFLPELVDNLKKIEAAYGGKPVDIEFAVKNGALFILQARPFITNNPAPADKQEQTLLSARKLNETIAGLPANELLCDMSDINPRELLGDRPKPLNISIFRHMFADNIVEQARGEMGYAPLYKGLLRDIDGKPYVSVRAAAYSFRPEGISAAAYDKMTDIYRQQIIRFPEQQDSVEFQVFRTNSRQLPQFFKDYPAVFSGNEELEITEAFSRLDRNLKAGIRDFCNAYHDALEEYREKIENLPDPTLREILDALQEGTFLFVKTARFAFYKKAAFDDAYGSENTALALRGLDTPSEKLQRDLLSFARHEKDKDALAAEYGHLRPGQMDMFAPVYRDDIAKNLNISAYTGISVQEINAREQEINKRYGDFMLYYSTLDGAHRKDIDDLRLVFSAREYVKHEFMKAYDRLAGKIKNIAGTAGFQDSQTARMSLDDALLLERDPSSKKMIEEKLSGENDPAFIMLPGVIHGDTDLRCMEISSKHGTYFSKKCVAALPLVVTDENLGQLKAEDVRGRILVMDHADPGYDFLLLYEPAGIITRIGGPASHIAIRVNERGLPACIGSGLDPQSIDGTKNYVLDCRNEKHYQGAASLPKGPENNPPANKNAPRQT